MRISIVRWNLTVHPHSPPHPSRNASTAARVAIPSVFSQNPGFGQIAAAILTLALRFSAICPELDIIRTFAAMAQESLDTFITSASRCYSQSCSLSWPARRCLSKGRPPMARLHALTHPMATGWTHGQACRSSLNLPTCLLRPL